MSVASVLGNSTLTSQVVWRGSTEFGAEGTAAIHCDEFCTKDTTAIGREGMKEEPFVNNLCRRHLTIFGRFEIESCGAAGDLYIMRVQANSYRRFVRH